MTPHEIRPDAKAFIDLLNATPLGKLEALTPDQARAIMAQMQAAAPRREHDLAVVRDLQTPGPGGPIPLRLYDRRTERGPGPLVVYFHGGGFMLGDLDSHHDLCADMAAALDAPLVAVDYRLAPEHPWPAAPEDAEAVARWAATAEGSAALGRQATSLVLAGDSAGANLAAVTARALRDGPAAAPVSAQFLMYPTIGAGHATPSCDAFAEGLFLTRENIRWFEEHYAPATRDPRYDLTVSAPEGMPPTLLFTAGLDPLRDEGRDYAATLIRAGVPVVYQEAKGNVHGCLSMTTAIPSSALDLDRALNALKPLLS